MSIEITHIRFGSTTKTHQTISELRWKNLSDGDTGSSTKATLVDWVDNKNGTAYVGSGTQRVNVGTVHPASDAAYLRTYADSQWTNNLLALSEF